MTHPVWVGIDIGGTKFTLALFEGERMIRRESRATDRENGRVWMLGQIEAIALEWKREGAIDRCGIGGVSPAASRAFLAGW